MKPQHSSQNELKPLTHNHQSQMLSATDSKTHYQSKFSSSDQTSTASYDNIDTIRARPMCGAHVWCGCNLETVLARFQKNLHQPPSLYGFSVWFTRVLCLKKITESLQRLFHWAITDSPAGLKTDISQRGKMLICSVRHETYSQAMPGIK